MPAQNTNKILKFAGFGLVILLAFGLYARYTGNDSQPNTPKSLQNHSDDMSPSKAAGDSAAESLNTLTAEMAETRKQISQVKKDDSDLKQTNRFLVDQLKSHGIDVPPQIVASTQAPNNGEVGVSTGPSPVNPTENDAGLKQATQAYIVRHTGASIPGVMATANQSQEILSTGEPFTTIGDISQDSTKPNAVFGVPAFSKSTHTSDDPNKKPKAIPYYTIPANATSVHDWLMTALVGRIPVKGVVVDPYPFKLVVSDDTLASNGLRVPHLKQMVVSGYCEGDLNLKAVRGWITSLTFTFEDGTISTVSSNDNNLGKFSKDNALGYLSDKYGNPFIEGTLITDAPEFLTTKIGLGVAAGMANAYAQSQTTNQTNGFGGNTSSVTGSPGKYMAGIGLASGANSGQQWFDDREQQSFDAIYVPTLGKDGQRLEIAVNFAKEIPINYDPTGRKVDYENKASKNDIHTDLD